MKYFVYFDAYGHARQIADEQELAQKYHNDPQEFLRAMSGSLSTENNNHTTGHVGTLKFDSKEELKDYLESLVEEITGFYGCRSESRPYNF